MGERVAGNGAKFLKLCSPAGAPPALYNWPLVNNVSFGSSLYMWAYAPCLLPPIAYLACQSLRYATQTALKLVLLALVFM